MSDSFQGIAIIGMAGQFPGAKTVTEFWRNLRDGRESISFFEDEELIAAGVDPSLVHSPSYVKANPVLDGIDQFDADFFDLSPIEAAVTDPQHRLFLESSWSALEHAGYDPSAYEGWIGVYAGGHLSTYLLRSLIDHRSYIENAIGWYALGIGNDKDYIPTRISYKMNLKGPSVNVSTACSTSLVAVHLACQGLLSYQCDMALAGGVCILVPHITGYLQEDGFVSPDGHCRTFDAKAQGTVFGSGLGVVVLKRLEDALADGDYIYAVIKGSAINNDGSHKVGFTAPSVDGQAKVIAEAQDFAGFDPETISYIEAHGTGTPMGDPIEVRALQKAFNTQKREFCAIGSAKTNVGHLNCASGITGLIKTTMALHHKQLPPSLNFEAPNPEIDFANTPFYVNTQLVDW
ncbi:MAG: polyketide synthase, partial [Pseudanabaenales cyanobacterium]|nr:polyketide synthase [Pseudanabaenales cyanobacterium]